MDIASVLSVLIAILSIVVVGAIGFWAIERFVTDRRLANPAQAASRACMSGRYCAPVVCADVLDGSAREQLSSIYLLPIRPHISTSAPALGADEVGLDIRQCTRVHLSAALIL